MAKPWIENRAVMTPPGVVAFSVVFFGLILVLGIAMSVVRSPIFLVITLAAVPGLVFNGYMMRLQHRR